MTETMTEIDRTVDDETKVYVSRLPKKWDDAILAEQFSALFGEVLHAKVRRDLDSGESRGFGFVVFADAAGKETALTQRSMHVQQRIIQIRDIERNASADTSVGICFAWQQFSCSRGEACKFLHEGEGGCVVANAAGQGLAKKCLQFKRKGRCSKGDNCPFRHVQSSGIIAAPAATKKSAAGICHNFKKKGVCRKGDNCRYLHTNPVACPVVGSAADAEGDLQPVKRRKLNGLALIHAVTAFRREGKVESKTDV